MGNDFSCQNIEIEEETLEKIFVNMSLKRHKPALLYQEFKEHVDLADKSLSYNNFETLTEKWIEPNDCAKAQLKFLSNLYSKVKSSEHVCKLGITVICFSENDSLSRAKLYAEHILQFYGTRRSDLLTFLYHCVELHTVDCIAAFKEELGSEGIKNLEKYLNPTRIDKLAETLIKGYDDLKSIQTFEESQSRLIEKYLEFNVDSLKPSSIRNSLYEDYSSEPVDQPVMCGYS